MNPLQDVFECCKCFVRRSMFPAVHWWKATGGAQEGDHLSKELCVWFLNWVNCNTVVWMFTTQGSPFSDIIYMISSNSWLACEFEGNCSRNLFNEICAFRMPWPQFDCNEKVHCRKWIIWQPDSTYRRKVIKLFTMQDNSQELAMTLPWKLELKKQARHDALQREVVSFLHLKKVCQM